jgi:hypothetical protein
MGHRQAPHAQRLPRFLVLARIKSRIGRHHARDSSQSLLAPLERGQQQSRICRPIGMHLKVSYDLVFRFLDLDQLAKLVALARFPFAIIFVCGQNTLPIFSGDLVSLRKSVSASVSLLAELSPPSSPVIASDLPLECDDAATASLRPVLSAPDLLLFASSSTAHDASTTASATILLRAFAFGHEYGSGDGVPLCGSYTVSRNCSSSSSLSTRNIHGSYSPSISLARPRCHSDGC